MLNDANESITFHGNKKKNSIDIKSIVTYATLDFFYRLHWYKLGI